MKNLIILPALVSFLLIASCKKKETATETPVATGTIAGKTSQYDQYGNLLSTGLNNVTIFLDNDNVTAVTDNSGNYSLEGVKPGIYTISFSKPGGGLFQIQQVNFPGNGTLYKDGIVIETPTFNFTSVTSVLVDSSVSQYYPAKWIKTVFNLSPVSKAVQAAVLLGSSGNLDINKAGSYFRPFIVSVPANTSSYSAMINISSYSNLTGDLYVKIYPYSGYTMSYHDYSTGNNINQGYGPPSAAIKIN